ncbi:hypothetical protein NL307_27330, partial [Klebsiella pneumoniae]|nr:hypothetical protein [Klebsiella pneumoniae]
VKTEGCTCEQIKRDVISAKAGDTLVTAVLGGVSVGDAKPDQIDTVFRALSAVKGVAPTNSINTVLNQFQHQPTNVGDQNPDTNQQKPSSKQ